MSCFSAKAPIAEENSWWQRRQEGNLTMLITHDARKISILGKYLTSIIFTLLFQNAIPCTWNKRYKYVYALVIKLIIAS